jgi:molybdenum cofactor sulfurtransferase
VLDSTKDVVACKDTNSAVSFANEGQFLLVSEESVSDLNKRLCSGIFLYPLEINQRQMFDWK